MKKEEFDALSSDSLCICGVDKSWHDKSFPFLSVFEIGRCHGFRLTMTKEEFAGYLLSDICDCGLPRGWHRAEPPFKSGRSDCNGFRSGWAPMTVNLIPGNEEVDDRVSTLVTASIAGQPETPLENEPGRLAEVEVDNEPSRWRLLEIFDD